MKVVPNRFGSIRIVMPMATLHTPTLSEAILRVPLRYNDVDITDTFDDCEYIFFELPPLISHPIPVRFGQTSRFYLDFGRLYTCMG